MTIDLTQLPGADLTHELGVVLKDFFGDNAKLEAFQLEITTPDGKVKLSWAISAKTL